MDKTLLKTVRCKQGPVGRLYYYLGNYYYPIGLHKKEEKRVRIAMRKHYLENSELVKKDRNKPDYRTKLELLEDLIL